jgi:hypothetical protein
LSDGTESVMPLFSRRDLLSVGPILAVGGETLPAGPPRPALVGALDGALPLRSARRAVYFVDVWDSWCFADVNLFGVLDGAPTPASVAVRFVEDTTNVPETIAFCRSEGMSFPYDSVELWSASQPFPTNERRNPKYALIVMPPPWRRTPTVTTALPQLIAAARSHAAAYGFSPLDVESTDAPPAEKPFAYSLTRDGVLVEAHEDGQDSSTWNINAALGDMLRGGLERLG